MGGRMADAPELHADPSTATAGQAFSGWERRELSQVAHIRYGLGQPPQESPSGLPIIRATNVKRGEISHQGLVFVDPADIPTSRDPFLKTGDMLVVRSGAYTVDVALVTEEWEGAVARYDLVVTPSNKVDASFLSYALLSGPVQAYFKSSRGRSAQPHLNANELGRTIVPIPPISEQREIARVLSVVRKAEQVTRGVIGATNELRKSLIESVLAGDRGSKWPVVKLGQVCHRPQYGLTASASLTATGPKFLRITDIQGGQVRWDDVPTCETSAEELDGHRLSPGDILVARIGATTGKEYLVQNCPGAVFASYLIIINAKSSIFPVFLVAFTESRRYWDQIDRQKGGSLRQGIHIPVLESLELPLPPMEEQQQFATAIRALFRRLVSERGRLGALEALYQTLLHDLLSGRTRLHAREG